MLDQALSGAAAIFMCAARSGLLARGRSGAPVTAVCALMPTAVPEGEDDKRGRTYAADLPNTSHALLELSG